MLLAGVMETVKQSLDMSSNPRIDIKLQTSLKNSNNQQFRTSTKPFPNNKEEESKQTTTQITNIIQTDNEKKLKTRIYVIQEIINTEEKYQKILIDLIENVIKPCRELKYLTKDQEKEIFSNVETIAKFSESFLSSLKTAYGQDFNPKKTLFAATIVKMQPFFRYYYPYCINFKDARLILEQLRKENPQFDQWLKNIELTKWDQVIDAVLIEPVQRMPRYVILMKELKKNTHNWHPDYPSIEQALKTFDDLNTTVNKHMEEYLKTLRLFELAAKYGKHFKDELVDPKRKFLAEEAMTLINDGETRQVVCYFLTDIMLITERVFTGDMKLIKSLHFGQKSYVLNLPNTKHYNHLITIYGEEEGLTFILESEESKSKIIQFINKSVLSEIKYKKPSNNLFSLDQDEISQDQSHQTNVIVKILGSIKRGMEKLSPFVVYFIRISYGNFLSEVFLRYRELKVLDVYVRSTFPDIKTSSFPKKKVFHQKTQTIEGRTLDIQNFLQMILNSNMIKANPIKVLKFLNLPATFYELHSIKAKENSFFQNMNDVGEKLLRRFSVFRVLFDFFHTKRPIYSLLTPDSEAKLLLREREIEIELPDGSKQIMMINKFTKALDLCYEIAQKLGLVSWLDFKLVLEKSEIDDRIVDDDEFVFKALNIDEFEMENPLENPNFLDKMYEILQNGEILIKGLFRAKFRLKWRKCIFLNNSIENIDYLIDPVKLNFMTSQVFQEIFQNKYDLSLNDYCLFAALFAYISYGSLIEIEKENFMKFIVEKVIFKIIPIKVFIRENKQMWVNLILMFWKKFTEEIEKIVEFNKFYNETIEENIMVSMLTPEQKINENNKFKFKINDGKILARMLAIKYIMNSENYGTKTYLAIYTKVKKNEENSLEVKKICKISVKYNRVKILDEFNKIIEEITLKNIEEFNVFPDFVEIALKETKPEEGNGKFVYRLYSSESINIYRSLELYSQIEILTSELHKKYVKKLKEENSKQNC